MADCCLQSWQSVAEACVNQLIASPIPRFCHSSRSPVKSAQKLFADDLNQNTLGPASIKLTVEDGLPGSEVKPAVGDGDKNLTSHNLTFVMGVTVVLARAIVLVTTDRFMRGKIFKPALVVFMQSSLVVVYEDTRGNVHCIDQAQSVLDSALSYCLLYLWRYVNEVHSGRDIESQVFRVAFHCDSTGVWNLVKTLSTAEYLHIEDLTMNSDAKQCFSQEWNRAL